MPLSHQEVSPAYSGDSGFRVEPMVTQPAPPQVRPCAIHADGASVTSVSAPLWRLTLLPRKTASESVDDCGCGHDEPLPPRLASFPAARTRVAATAAPDPPGVFHLPTDHVQPAGIPAHPSVLAVAPSLLAPPPVVVLPRERAIDPTPSPPRLGRARPALPGGLAFAPPISPA